MDRNGVPPGKRPLSRSLKKTSFLTEEAAMSKRRDE